MTITNDHHVINVLNFDSNFRPAMKIISCQSQCDNSQRKHTGSAAERTLSRRGESLLVCAQVQYFDVTAKDVPRFSENGLRPVTSREGWPEAQSERRKGDFAQIIPRNESPVARPDSHCDPGPVVAPVGGGMSP